MDGWALEIDPGVFVEKIQLHIEWAFSYFHTLSFIAAGIEGTQSGLEQCETT